MRKAIKKTLCAITAVAVLMMAQSSALLAFADVGEIKADAPALKLVYNKAGTSSIPMDESLPLGNGYMGATVYGDVHRDEIQVNEHTLWSGGPGANANYNGGMNSLSQNEVHNALMTARSGLQDQMTDFTENYSAYVDDNGNVIAENYPSNSSELVSALGKLKGDRTYFGNYQTFGNFIFEDSLNAKAKVLEVDSNELATQANQKAPSLFDGDKATKWYSIAGVPGSTNPVQPNPCWISVHYSKALNIKGYTITSGDDVPDRDPKDWIMYGSNDGQNWTKIDERQGNTFAERSQDYSFDLQEPCEYSWFKMEITDIRGGFQPKIGVQMSELTFDTVAGSDEEDSYTDYLRSLDIDNALANVSYKQNGVSYSREYFISYPDNVTGVRLSNDGNVAMKRRISFESPQTAISVVASQSDKTITVTGSPADQVEEERLKFAGQLKVELPSGGTVSTQDSALLVENAPEIVVYWTTGTNYNQCDDDSFDYFSDEDPLDAVEARISNACQKGYDKVRADHIADYKNLFDRVKLSLNGVKAPDKLTDELIDDCVANISTVEESRYYEILYFQYGRYLLISSSRENTLPANLQGIWCNELTPRWQSDYHTNINLQMNYWAAETTNLAECHTAELDYIKSLVPRGKETAQHYHCTEDGGDVRGWTTYHQNNIWGNTNPGNYGTAFYFPTAAAWLCQDIFDYYAFNRDEEALEEYYDTIKEAALFWVDNLVTDTRDGTLVSSPSYSPEHGPFSLGTSADQSLIWELFRNTIELAEAKGDNSSEIEEIKTSMSRLSMPKIGLAGQYQEWKDEIQLDITGDNHHRHTNHLVGLFPGTYVVPGRSGQDDAFAAAIKETLNVRGDTDVGWAFAWRTVIYSKLNDGEKAFKEYSKLIRGNGKRQAVGDNLFDVYTAVSPVLFQIDANLGGVSGVAEMLLSSTNYVIKPLAALPNVWKDGAYTGLRARGDFTVDAAWSDGTLDKMSVLSGSGEDCTVDCSDFETASVTCGGKKVAYTKNADGTITFKTEIGKNYVITNGNGNVIIDGGDEVVKGLSGGAIAGICIGGAAVAAGGTTGVVFLCRKRRNKTSK